MKKATLTILAIFALIFLIGEPSDGCSMVAFWGVKALALITLTLAGRSLARMLPDEPYKDDHHV